MGQITINVNDQKYTIACRDGEEERLATLGEYVDSKVSELTSTLGQVGEPRILLMAALLVADELHDTMDRLANAKARNKNGGKGAATGAAPGAANENDGRIAALLGEAADALEGIAVELESA